MSNIDPIPGLNDAMEEKTEEEKMKEVYERLEKDLRREDWEQRKRKKNEERKGKEEERKKEMGLETRKEEWEGEEEKEGVEEWRRRQEEEKGERKKEEEQREKEKKEAVDQSYEKLQAEVKKYDDGMVLAWKEDIDTLLVFAGLFSAVVTAFLIESYQWLSEDDTVLLLTQISQQLNGTQTKPAPFSPEASSIRINCFWFLSLIFSLTSALFGLLCKQWLREHQRDVPTRTVAENLALQQLRRDSFEKWGVVSFLSALPILLELALVFFFVGVLDLLWTLQPIVFSICLAAISLSMGLYILTTILPTITLPRDQTELIEYREFGKLAYQYVCPYKSPQAWAVYKLFITLPKPLLRFPAINKFTKTHLRPLWDHIQAQTSSWSTFDLRVVRQFDQEVALDVTWRTFRLQIYELQALQWAIKMFRDSPSMIPRLENVLKTLPRSVVVFAVLDRRDIMMWEGREKDISEYLRYPYRFRPLPKLVTSDPPLHSQKGIELLFCHRIWSSYLEWYSDVRIDLQGGFLSEFKKEISSGVYTLSKMYRFPIPLPFATALWLHKEPPLRRLGLQLLRHFEEAWKPFPGYEDEQHNKERVAFVKGLVWHIRWSDPPSVLLTSKRGQEFIRFIHHKIITHRLYRERSLGLPWQYTIKKVQEVGNLPDDYFAPFFWYEHSPPPPEFSQLEHIRYSLDTVHTQPDNPRNEDEARPHSPGDCTAEIINIHVDGNRRNIMSGVTDLAEGTLLPSNTNQGDSGIQAINEDHPLQLADNGEPTTVGTAARGANPGFPGVQVMTSMGIAEGSSIPLSAEDNEPAVPREAVAPDTNPDHLVQATEDGAQASPLEGQGEKARDKHRLEALDAESSAFRPDNDEPATSRTVAVGINPDCPQECAEGLSAPLTTGGDEPGVPRGLVSPDTVPDSPTQASEDAARNIDSLPDSKGQDERDRDKDGDQGIIGTGGSTMPSSSLDRGQKRLRRDEGRGSNMMNDPNHLQMHQFRT